MLNRFSRSAHSNPTRRLEQITSPIPGSVSTGYKEGSMIRAFVIWFWMALTSLFAFASGDPTHLIKSWDGDIEVEVANKLFSYHGNTRIMPYRIDDRNIKFSVREPRRIIMYWSFYPNCDLNQIKKSIQDKTMPIHLAYLAWESDNNWQSIDMCETQGIQLRSNLGNYSQILFFCQANEGILAINVFYNNNINDAQSIMQTTIGEIFNQISSKSFNRLSQPVDFRGMPLPKYPTSLQESYFMLNELLNDSQKQRLIQAKSIDEFFAPPPSPPGLEYLGNPIIDELITQWGLGLNSPISIQLKKLKINDSEEQLWYIFKKYKKYLSRR